MSDGPAVGSLLEDRPEFESALEATLDVDEEEDSRVFDDVPTDSGTFGELVSRGVVETVGDGYRLADLAAVRAARAGDVRVDDPVSDRHRKTGFRRRRPSTTSSPSGNSAQSPRSTCSRNRATPQNPDGRLTGHVLTSCITREQRPYRAGTYLSGGQPGRV